MFYRMCFALFLMIFMGGEASAQARGPVRQRTLMTVPPGAEIDKFPIMGDTLTQVEMNKLGLKKDTLDVAWAGFNWFRNVGRFAWDSLPAGTVVLVDTSGKIRYKADCGNRLVEKEFIREALVATGTSLSLPDSIALAVSLSGSIDVNHHFDDRLYESLARAGASTSGGVDNSGRSSNFFWNNFSKKEKWWIVGGTVVLTTAAIILSKDEVNVKQVNGNP